MPLKSRYNVQFSGDVTYGNKVVRSIIELAVMEVNGVASLHGKGVRSRFSGNTVSVDVFINVYSFVSCTELAYKVQENIKLRIETTTQYKAGVINVNVLGLRFKDKEQE